MDHANQQIIVKGDQEKPLPRSEAIHLRLNEKMAHMRVLMENYKEMMVRIGHVFDKIDSGEDVMYKARELVKEYQRFDNQRRGLQAEIHAIITHHLQK